MRNKLSTIVLGAVTLCLGVPVSTRAQVEGFYIDLAVNYPSTGPCAGNLLYDDTADIQSAMTTDGWTGHKYSDSQAWATDWREACSTVYGSGGQDSLYTDNATLSIWSGHGDASTAYFTTAHDVCPFNINNQARLGMDSGAQAAVAMYFSCYTLNTNTLGNQWLWQQLGFWNETGNNSTAYKYMYLDSNGKSNAQAWLDRLWNQPADVQSFANGSNSCWDVDSSAQLRGGIHVTPRTPGGNSCGTATKVQTVCERWNSP